VEGELRQINCLAYVWLCVMCVCLPSFSSSFFFGERLIFIVAIVCVYDNNYTCVCARTIQILTKCQFLQICQILANFAFLSRFQNKPNFRYLLCISMRKKHHKVKILKFFCFYFLFLSISHCNLFFLYKLNTTQQ
jgi:hypothetical protein